MFTTDIKDLLESCGKMLRLFLVVSITSLSLLPPCVVPKPDAQNSSPRVVNQTQNLYLPAAAPEKSKHHEKTLLSRCYLFTAPEMLHEKRMIGRNIELAPSPCASITSYFIYTQTTSSYL